MTTAAQPPIKVLLVDDNESIHQGLGFLLNALADIKLVGQGRNGEQAIALCEQHSPDVVLMDVNMPVMNGIIATREIVRRLPGVKVIAMTGLSEADVVQKMLAAGAISYVLKEVDPEELANTIRAVQSGQAVFSMDVMKPLLNPNKSSQDYGLSAREQQVLTSLAQGQTNAQIAQELGISQPTVRFHMYNILDKLGVQTRSEALVLAARVGLV